MNSIGGIERCLTSLRASGVGAIIVVDASSTDGTREVAERLADRVVTDPGEGLGNARNAGISWTTSPLILNMGSDNVMPPGQLARMITILTQGGFQGVSAQTVIEGDDFATRGLNAWRTGRLRPGPSAIIGTPTLFDAELLRQHPFDPSRVFSDDSELCERWAREFGARFAISDAHVLEVGKISWSEILTRCRMYGISDEEVQRRGRESGWGLARQAKSMSHPFRVDFLAPLTHLPPTKAVSSASFLAAFTGMRYWYWLRASVQRSAR
jgi:glycosyltransferase involved in cell wall biosynthesis